MMDAGAIRKAKLDNGQEYDPSLRYEQCSAVNTAARE